MAGLGKHGVASPAPLCVFALRFLRFLIAWYQDLQAFININSQPTVKGGLLAWPSKPRSHDMNFDSAQGDQSIHNDKVGPFQIRVVMLRLGNAQECIMQNIAVWPEFRQQHQNDEIRMCQDAGPSQSSGTQCRLGHLGMPPSGMWNRHCTTAGTTPHAV